ncbi:two-component system sensor histidine kinase MtrB [Actinoalloteichus hoggarensis]|uniref:histidine kinase n=1 Tax=Actinoalloteichus hoggarensis TaxID=1470176 RepID=A0A221W5J4_9PSEU|nr:HAMP domain-containing sensor histidine kinase [Actinoalloteichus hoggarensis]ASO21115.1 Sensor histidine kinase MtrB [Actinoalloteichus hoggarensis]MBB5921044.1 two-component system sensor histidine kinase MtrB [Actinoalloteichus hoggarensis]
MIRRLGPRGLRARLVLAFVLVTVLGAAAASWSSAGSASAALLDSTERRLVETVTNRIEEIAPQIGYPPDREELDRLRLGVGADAVVTYAELTAANGTRLGLIDDAFRAAVGGGNRLVTRRVVVDGRPWLLIGTPVLTTAPDGGRTPSGVEVYAVHDLADVQERIDGLAWSAVGTAAWALPPAVLLALLASAGVLRPVRELRDTAERLAAGDLGARSPPQGADELAELTMTINAMAAAVETSMTAMRRMQADARRFAADVSHELRTPLSTLTAVLEVLAASADGMEDDARESTRLAIAETRRLVRLVEDLIEVSRFDAGTAVLRRETVDVVGVVRDCLRARGRLEQVELVAPPSMELALDPRRLDVIVANLVGNAMQHGAPPVRVGVEARDDELWIEVADHGPGLDPEVLPHVFDRFYKADTARGRAEGSGLGLAIARENARLHGGDVVASDGDGLGVGARFVLRMPARREDP